MTSGSNGEKAQDVVNALANVDATEKDKMLETHVEIKSEQTAATKKTTAFATYYRKLDRLRCYTLFWQLICMACCILNLTYLIINWNDAHFYSPILNGVATLVCMFALVLTRMNYCEMEKQAATNLFCDGGIIRFRGCLDDVLFAMPQRCDWSYCGDYDMCCRKI